MTKLKNWKFPIGTDIYTQIGTSIISCRVIGYAFDSQSKEEYYKLCSINNIVNIFVLKRFSTDKNYKIYLSSLLKNL